MSKRLANQVAIITGSTSGIGRESALLFAAEGASIVVNGFPAEAGPVVVAEIQAQGGQAVYCRADVRRGDDLRQLMQCAMTNFGRLDILMNNAFCGRSAEVVEQAEDDWDEVFASSVKAAYLGCKYAIPLMREGGGGSIINISSVHGLLGSNRNAAYTAAKAALLNLTRQMAVDYGPQQIRVNAICPGWIGTAKEIEWLNGHPASLRRQSRIYPLGRPGTMREVAQAALFLASSESSFITGHTLVVDGGLTIQLQDSLAGRIERGLRDEMNEENKADNVSK